MRLEDQTVESDLFSRQSYDDWGRVIRKEGRVTPGVDTENAVVTLEYNDADQIVRKVNHFNYDLDYTALDPNDKIHANFNLHSTKTGRYSCNSPSLQVWPRPVHGLPNIRNFIKTRFKIN